MQWRRKHAAVAAAATTAAAAATAAAATAAIFSHCALPKIIKTGFSAINLIYFFTAGPDEACFITSCMALLHEHGAEALGTTLTVLSLFFFAWLGVLTRGGSYNPLTILAATIIEDFPSVATGSNLEAMPRTQLVRIVKQLWEYMRKNTLQDPSNKRSSYAKEDLIAGAMDKG